MADDERPRGSPATSPTSWSRSAANTRTTSRTGTHADPHRLPPSQDRHRHPLRDLSNIDDPPSCSSWGWAPSWCCGTRSSARSWSTLGYRVIADNRDVGLSTNCDTARRAGGSPVPNCCAASQVLPSPCVYRLEDTWPTTPRPSWTTSASSGPTSSRGVHGRDDRADLRRRAPGAQPPAWASSSPNNSPLLPPPAYKALMA